MDLRDALRVLRRRWLSVVTILVIALVVTGFLTFRQVPQYESTAQLFVSSPATASNKDNGATYLNGLAATQKAPSYAELVTQTGLTSTVVDKLNLDTTPTRLAAQLDATASTDSALIKVSARDPDREQAQRICAAVASTLSAMIAEIETPPRSKTPLLRATVTDSASLPTSPVSPSYPLNLAVAGLLGLLLGAALAIVRERTDTSLRTYDEVAQALGAAVLGSVGNDGRPGKEPLIENQKTYTPLAEAFRVIRTNLQFIDVDSEQKTLVVTSALPGEGKTTTAVNVAVSMAAAGRRVLLVDADLRRPRIAEYLHMEGAVGVTSVLLRKVGLDDAVQKHSSGMHLLASGPTPPNPAELLQSHAMSALLEEARSRYEVVVLDSPPLLPVTDAALLAAQTDGALVVVRFGRTTRDQVAGAVARLDGVGSRVLGAVINRVPARAAAYGYGYTYGYGYAPTTGATSSAEWTAPLREEGPGPRRLTSSTAGDDDATGSDERLELSAFWRARGESDGSDESGGSSRRAGR